MSVSKLTNDSKCCVSFFYSNCEFQDLSLGAMIDNVRLIHSLYYFDDNSFNNKQVQGLSDSFSSIYVRDRIIFWYLWLGHPSFLYFKHLFPTLYKNADCSSFHFKRCYLSKSHHVSYLSNSYHASKPFYLIHIDVWDLSRIITNSDKRLFVTFIDDHTRLCCLFFYLKNLRLRIFSRNSIPYLKHNFKPKSAFFYK